MDINHTLRSSWIQSGIQDMARYKAWLELGLYGNMLYLASDRHLAARENPRLICPDLDSILVFSVPYAHPDSFPLRGYTKLHGRIASYAWQSDYHKRFLPVFEQLVDELSRQINQPFKWKGFTDSAPILERQMAVQAGLGWIGKNGCLIHPREGSFFLLGELFTSLEIASIRTIHNAPGEQIPDRCGTCRLCLEACPTGCIRDDRTLDASRCISYLTIEHKGIIPRELRRPMGNWISGCDICQLVCPWNKRQINATLSIDVAIPSPFPDLIEQSKWTEAEFKTAYRETAVLRPKWKGFIRNCAVALGNSNHPDAVKPLLELLLEHIEPEVRIHAAGALGGYHSDVVRDTLRLCSLTDTDERVREECRISLREIGG